MRLDDLNPHLWARAVALVDRNRYALLLALMMAVIFVQPFLGGWRVWDTVAVLAIAAVLAAGFRVSVPGTRVARLGVAATAVWAGLSILVVWDGGTWGVTAIVAMAVALGALSVWATVSALVRRTEADLDGLFGAIFGYFLIALVFGQIYVALEVLHPGSFAGPAPFERRDDLVYFSLVTITTLGYGDIAPVSPVARLAAGVEAAVGTLYIAILIGRIVGALKPR